MKCLYTIGNSIFSGVLTKISLKIACDLLKLVTNNLLVSKLVKLQPAVFVKKEFIPFVEFDCGANTKILPPFCAKLSNALLNGSDNEVTLFNTTNE